MTSTRYGAKKAGLRRRINDNCKDCIYDESDAGTWRKQVEKCTITDCALYDVRPVSESRKND